MASLILLVIPQAEQLLEMNLICVTRRLAGRDDPSAPVLKEAFLKFFQQ